MTQESPGTGYSPCTIRDLVVGVYGPVNDHERLARFSGGAPLTHRPHRADRADITLQPLFSLFYPCKPTQ